MGVLTNGPFGINNPCADPSCIVCNGTIAADVAATSGISPVLSGETIITDPNTGGQKGSKPNQQSTLDPIALGKVGEVGGFGAQKYERYNFLKGYRWSLSYDALQRHLQAFWSREDNDPESGLAHLAHAAWHCLALISFQVRGLGTDDRPPAITKPEPLPEPLEDDLPF